MNVIQGKFFTRNGVEPDKVLEGAKGLLTDVLVIGYEKDDGIYFASSTGDTSELLFLLEKFKFKVLRGDFN